MVVGAIVVVTCVVDIDSEVVAVVTTVSRQLPNQPYEVHVTVVDIVVGVGVTVVVVVFIVVVVVVTIVVLVGSSKQPHHPFVLQEVVVVVAVVVVLKVVVVCVLF